METLKRLYRFTMMALIVWATFGGSVQAQDPLSWTLTTILRAADGRVALHYTREGEAAYVMYSHLGQFMAVHTRAGDKCTIQRGGTTEDAPCTAFDQLDAARRLFFERRSEAERMGKT